MPGIGGGIFPNMTRVKNLHYKSISFIVNGNRFTIRPGISFLFPAVWSYSVEVALENEGLMSVVLFDDLVIETGTPHPTLPKWASFRRIPPSWFSPFS